MEDNQLERYQYPMGQITMINLNETAIEKLKELIAEEDNPALKLRVFVQGGGCSGFQYGFTFDDEKTEDDFDLEFDGVQVLVDSMSAQYLQGATIKYTSDAMGSNFSIDNPQATTTCGCGSSFSV
jgi:iron-sulfur cluster insertion protein